MNFNLQHYCPLPIRISEKSAKALPSAMSFPAPGLRTPSRPMEAGTGCVGNNEPRKARCLSDRGITGRFRKGCGGVGVEMDVFAVPKSSDFAAMEVKSSADHSHGRL